MNRFFKITILFLVFISFTATGYSADIAKIGIVDFQRILKDSKAGKVVAKKLREKQKERTIALKDKQKEIKALQKKIESPELVGNKEEREKKQLELDNKIAAFTNLEKKFSKALKDINSLETAKIKKDVNTVVIKVGKKGGYLLIVEKKDVLYSPDAVDITSRVIKQYDKAYKGR